MRQARYSAGAMPHFDSELPSSKSTDAVSQLNEGTSKPTVAKRDFFGRIINDSTQSLKNGIQSDYVARQMNSASESKGEREIWVSFHEGFSNAVRKPITLEELMKGF